MGSDIIDFDDERSRHREVFGREDVLTKIHAWLDGERPLPCGWVLLLGGPGIGKSAIIARLLDEMKAPTAYHFIRRGVEGWDRPEVLVQNLCAQIERLFPERAKPDLSTEARLSDLLKHLSRNVLVPLDRRLVLVVDGLDEAAGHGSGKNPLPSFLPRTAPPGVVIVCASRPMFPHLAWLDEREGVRRIDLDDAAWAASNETACRAFWKHHAEQFSPPLNAAFVEEAVRRAGGNLLHARRLRDWLEEQPPSERTATAIPVGLNGFLERIWVDELARDTRATRGLGLACVAREALPAYLFGELLGGSTTDGDAFLRTMRPFLLAEPAHWHDGQRAYRPYHEHFREFVAEKIGPPTVREHHRRLAEALAAWPSAPRDPARRRYALRHAVAHRIEGGDLEGALQLSTDISYLEAKCREVGVLAVERDLEAVIRALGADVSLDLAAVLTAVTAQSKNLGEQPSTLATTLYNYLRCAGWPAARIERVLRFDGASPPLRLLHGVRLGPTLLKVFSGHEKAIVACAATPDGRHVISASADGTLRVWAPASGACVGVLRGHEGEIIACTMSPGGDMLASASADATVRLWDVAALSSIAKLDNGGRWATACAFSPDGRILVIGSDNGALTLWHHAALERAGVLSGHTDYVTACLVTAEGRVVSASRDKSVRVWDGTAGTCLHTLVSAGAAPQETDGTDAQGWITALTLTPDGRQVLAARDDGSLSRWDLETGHCVQCFGSNQGRVDACAFLHDGRYLVSGISDGTVAIWDLAAEQRVRSLPAHAGAASACCVMPDGRRLLSGSSDRLLKLWEIGGPESLMVQDGHAAPIAACAMTLDGSMAVSASEDRTLKIWDIKTGACRVTLDGHTDLVTACAISANGLHVLSGARDGSVRLWSAAEGDRVLGDRYWASPRVSGCAMLPDGQMLTATSDGALRTHDAERGGAARELDLHDGSIEGIAVTPDGARAISISRDGTAKLWNIPKRRCERTLRGFAAQVLSVALTPDGRHAVLALADGHIEVRDVHSSKLVRSLGRHEGRIFGCAVTPDGNRVVSASEDCTLRIWSMADGRCLGVLHGTSWFRCVAAANGRICAGDQEGNFWMIVDDSQAPQKRPRRDPPVDQAFLARLRNALARLFLHVEKAIIIAQETGLDARRLAWTGSPEEIWHSIVQEAVKQGRLRALARCARSEYPEDPELLALETLLGPE